MSDLDDGPNNIIDPKERKKLILDIANIKDVLDSYKYGLNFEEFAESLFKTIDRQTIAVKQLDNKMTTILERMAKLETRLDEGIKVRVKGFSSEGAGGQDDVIIEAPPEEVPDLDGIPSAEDKAAKDRLRTEISEITTKIGRLFEKENELDEMVLTDPASADEYTEKARVAKEMRLSLEAQLKQMKETLGK